MFLRLLGLLFLMCFSCASTLDAKNRHISHEKTSHKASAKKKSTALKKVRSKKAKAKKPKKIKAKKQKPAKQKKGKQRRQKRSGVRPAPIQPVQSTPTLPTVPTPFSLLNPYNQMTAKAGGLEPLLSKTLHGQGQTVAMIECNGTWKEMNDVIHKGQGTLPSQVRANYTTNFLPPIGGSNLDPNVVYARLPDNPYHGSQVASVVLDYAPQAKVLPTSTTACFNLPFSYSVANALFDLSRREDVKIINISSGYFDRNADSKHEYDSHGTSRYSCKFTNPPDLSKAVKEISKKGKILVIGAGNEGKEIETPQYTESTGDNFNHMVGELLDSIDAETRSSIIVAGNIDAESRTLFQESNRPGTRADAQGVFLCAPGGHVMSWSGAKGNGTSLSAPYICAALADLMSMSPNITPKRARQALFESAEKRPGEDHLYGRGIIRADKAAELLEREGI